MEEVLGMVSMLLLVFVLRREVGTAHVKLHVNFDQIIFLPFLVLVDVVVVSSATVEADMLPLPVLPPPYHQLSQQCGVRSRQVPTDLTLLILVTQSIP